MDVNEPDDETDYGADAGSEQDTAATTQNSTSDLTDFEQFMAARWLPLVRTAYVLTGSRQDAEDIAQTALANAFSVWPRIRKSDDVTVYVHRILINVYRTSRRRRRAHEVLMSVVPERLSGGHGTAAHTADVHDRDEIVQALALLTARQRAVIVLRYLEDLTEAQTAHVLGCSVGTVKSQTSKSLAKLRAQYSAATQLRERVAR